jgi:hypothetical protein
MKPCLNFVTSTTAEGVAAREEDRAEDTAPRCCRREEEVEEGMMANSNNELPLWYEQLSTMTRKTM